MFLSVSRCAEPETDVLGDVDKWKVGDEIVVSPYAIANPPSGESRLSENAYDTISDVVSSTQPSSQSISPDGARSRLFKLCNAVDSCTHHVVWCTRYIDAFSSCL